MNTTETMYEEPKNRFKLSSKIACAPAFEKLIHMKLSYYFLAAMMPLLKNDTEAEGCFDLEMIRRSFGNRDDMRTHMAIKDLEKYVIDWDSVVTGKVSWGSTYLFERCEVDYRGDVRVVINKALVPEINNPHSYKKIDLNLLLAFNSLYAFKLYTFCNQFFMEKEYSGRTPNLQSNKLRKLLSCDENTYPRDYDFIKFVINTPLLEIEKVARVSFEFNHDRHHIYSRRYWFTFSEQGDKKNPAKEYDHHMRRIAALIKKKNPGALAEFEKATQSIGKIFDGGDEG